MSEQALELDAPTEKVFIEVRQHKAMPFLEIAAVTGVRGSQLRESLGLLVRENLVKLSKAEDMTNSIVSFSGSACLR
jgi:hypothetical protein